MNVRLVILLVLAGGYLALALYGKYRKLRDEYRLAAREEARRENPRQEPDDSS